MTQIDDSTPYFSLERVTGETRAGTITQTSRIDPTLGQLTTIAPTNRRGTESRDMLTFSDFLRIPPKYRSQENFDKLLPIILNRAIEILNHNGLPIDISIHYESTESGLQLKFIHEDDLSPEVSQEMALVISEVVLEIDRKLREKSRNRTASNQSQVQNTRSMRENNPGYNSRVEDRRVQTSPESNASTNPPPDYTDGNYLVAGDFVSPPEPDTHYYDSDSEDDEIELGSQTPFPLSQAFYVPETRVNPYQDPSSIGRNNSELPNQVHGQHSREWHELHGQEHILSFNFETFQKVVQSLPLEYNTNNFPDFFREEISKRALGYIARNTNAFISYSLTQDTDGKYRADFTVKYDFRNIGQDPSVLVQNVNDVLLQHFKKGVEEYCRQNGFGDYYNRIVPRQEQQQISTRRQDRHQQVSDHTNYRTARQPRQDVLSQDQRQNIRSQPRQTSPYSTSTDRSQPRQSSTPVNRPNHHERRHNRNRRQMERQQQSQTRHQQPNSTRPERGQDRSRQAITQRQYQPDSNPTTNQEQSIPKINVKKPKTSFVPRSLRRLASNFRSAITSAISSR